MTGITSNGKLRQWLIEQVDSGKYPGLAWEDREKTVFRIPWKHAGKQDYNRDEDAALFKSWALFKGKYREGIDKPDPPTWKTRLRCALNKSNDFEELVERSQLDTSDPYKVYRVIPEGAKRGSKSYESNSALTSPHNYQQYPVYAPLQSQVCNFLSPAERSWRDFLPDQAPFTDIQHAYGQNSYTPHWDSGYQITGSFYSCSSPSSFFNLDQSMRQAEALALSDPRLQVSVFSGDSLVTDVTIHSVEGCRLTLSEELQVCEAPGGPEPVTLPQGSGRELEGGVLLWMAQDGLRARRLCTARVYWDGAQAPFYPDKPNKLEREQTSKLLDVQLFITELQSSYLQGRPLPRFQVLLFLEECNDAQTQKKPITVQVEPLFVRQLQVFFGQQGGSSSGGGYTRGPELLPTLWEQQDYIPSSDPHQHHSAALQDWHPSVSAVPSELGTHKRDGHANQYRARLLS